MMSAEQIKELVLLLDRDELLDMKISFQNQIQKLRDQFNASKFSLLK